MCAYQIKLSYFGWCVCVCVHIKSNFPTLVPLALEGCMCISAYQIKLSYFGACVRARISNQTFLLRFPLHWKALSVCICVSAYQIKLSYFWCVRVRVRVCVHIKSNFRSPCTGILTFHSRRIIKCLK